MGSSEVMEIIGDWPPSGLSMGEFRVSPYRNLTGKGPLRYVEYIPDVSNARVVSEDGCLHSPSCFTCPLSECHYVKKGSSKRSVPIRSLRNAQLIKLRQKGYSVGTLVERFGISTRMVYKVLEEEALHVVSG